jgi:hypothetical protein
VPLRPEGIAGVLISDVDCESAVLHLGTRFAGNDFSKGGTTIQMPLPSCLLPLLRACIGDRADGPLFRTRSAFVEPTEKKEVMNSRADLEGRYYDALACAPRGSIQTIQDRKLVFRKLLRQLGGVSEDQISKELRTVLPVGTPHRPYDLRGSITQGMKMAGIHQMELRYLSEHSVKDILNDYTGLDPAAEMAKYFTAIQSLLDAIKIRATELKVI